MSGIVGVLDLGGGRVEERLLRAMAQPIRHRGPDGTELVRKDGLAVAFLRQGKAPSATRGPMATGGPALLFMDGELTDRSPFERALARRGRISLGSDAEILLEALELGGNEMLLEMDGGFALVAWWPRPRRLLLARDRFGCKPLYFARVKKGIAFASEIKALLEHPEIPRRLDPKGLDQVLTFWSTVAPRTMVEGVQELPPGHFLEAGESGVTIERYWSLDLNRAESNPEAEQLASRLALELEASVRKRLRGQGPVGAYVSGGLDSTIIATLARRAQSNVLSTFSVSFSHPVYDESLEQRRVVKQIGSKHSSLPCASRDIAAVFPEVIRHVETPLVRTAPAPLFLLARVARKAGMRAVLTGEGADELFGGYDLFKEVKVRRFCAAAPGSLIRPLLFRRLYHYMPALRAMPVELLASFYKARPEDLADPFFSHRPRWGVTSSLKRLYGRDVREALSGYDPIDELARELPAGFEEWDPFSRAQFLEATILLPSLLAVQGDRVAMASGVSPRSPFLDRRIVDLASSLPTSLKMRGLREKFILRQARSGLLPEEMRQRVKQPYRAPEAACFLPHDGGEDTSWTKDILSEESLRRAGLFEPAGVAALVRKIEAGGIPNARDDMAVVAVVSTGLLVDQLGLSLGGNTNA